MKKKPDEKISIEITGRQCSIVVQALIEWWNVNEKEKLDDEKKNEAKFRDVYEQYGNEIKELIGKFDSANCA